MRDLFLFAVFLSYLALGLRAPFVLGLGYIWVDFFNPQRMAFSWLATVPVSLLMGIAALLGFLFQSSKRDLPRFGTISVLVLSFALWVTLTTLWAEVPAAAWEKWDWAFKTICFSAFLPFLFRTRIQLEAMLLTVALSLGGAFLAAAAKTAVGGGGYNLSLGIIQGNAGIAESGALACLGAAVIPILTYMHRSALFIKNKLLSFCVFYFLIVAAIMTVVGTFERTGLVSLAALAFLTFPSVKRKALYVTAIVFGVAVSGYFLSEKWLDRMSTIQNYQSDLSAMVRIKVWEWTIDYAIDHPLGGGFEVYRINQIEVPVKRAAQMTADGKFLPARDAVQRQSARAFHSMYFEVLGEQGFVGFAIFGALIISFYSMCLRIYRRTKFEESLQWAHALARCLLISVTVYLVGGTFEGIAFQPFLYDFIAAGVILNECVRRQFAREIPKLPLDAAFSTSLPSTNL